MAKDRAEIIRGENFTSHLRKHGKVVQLKYYKAKYEK